MQTTQPQHFTRPVSRIEDWFSTARDFEHTLAKAVENSRTSPKNLDMLADIKNQWDIRGMKTCLSRKVYQYLCNLADVDECPGL